MFEDSLFASGIAPDSKINAKRRRRIALASIAVQGIALAGFLAVPLIWPETLPLVSVAPKITSLLLKKPEVKVVPKPVHVEMTNSAAVTAPSAPRMVESRAPGIFQHGRAEVEAAGLTDPGPGSSLNMGGGPGLPVGFGPGGGGGGNAPNVAARHIGPVNVSSGVIKGLLIAPITPVYPMIAKAARVEGTVVLTAIIDKHGRITELHVQSGNPMLNTAALDAVKQAHYQPYLLNGEPTEVETTISVIFHLGS